MSPTIHHKYKYFHSTVQRAKDRRQKFHFCRLKFDVRPRNVKLNLSKCCGFPSEKLAKVRNNSQLLSEFDCCYLVLRYRRFLKANFNVQLDDQLEFYNVTV